MSLEIVKVEIKYKFCVILLDTLRLKLKSSSIKSYSAMGYVQ